LAELLRHEHASLALAQRCSAVAAPAPLFTSFLNYRHSHLEERHSTAGRALDGVQALGADARSNYPLQVSIDDLGEEFWLTAKVQSPADPARICGYLHAALEELVAALETSPTTALRSLEVMPALERRQLLVQWNDTARDYGREARIHRLIEEQAAATPDAIALEFEGQILSYAEMNRRANQLARVLRKKGVGPDVLVGVFSERSFEMVLTLLAILKAGGAYVPLDPAYPAERLAHMLEDARASLVLAQQHLARQLPAQATDVHLLDPSWAAYANEAGDDHEDVGTPRNLAYVIFTSGSTGRPKGAMNEHRGVCNRLLWLQERFGLAADDRVMQKTAISFDPSVREFFWPLLAGARLVIARPEGHRDPAYLVDLIRKRQITHLQFVPSMLRVFLEEQGVESCTSLKRVLCSGEALTRELQERFFARLPGAELHNLYGPTECSMTVGHWACQRGDGRLTVPIGRPGANARLHVLDTALRPVPIGAPGELHIGGIQVGRGYAGRPDLTAERFIKDPFSDVPEACLYKTGDLARHLQDGAIEYLGRIDDQIKFLGFRVELGEIEATLETHPAVAQSAVVVREDDPGDQRLVAYVQARGAGASASALKEYLSRKLPPYMVPGAFVFVQVLPLTASGKVDRKALPASGRSGSSGSTYVAPRTPTEETLASIWAEVLKLERIGVEDDFFELGGHSLLAMRVVSRVREALDVDLSMRDLFTAPTVQSLSAVIEALTRLRKSEGEASAQRDGEEFIV
jgi:amino acid adenylation domain-containing protein